MNFIKIQPDKCIKVDEIESLESIDQLRTRVYMKSGSIYEAMFPYETLLVILQIEETKPVMPAEVLQNLNAVLKTSGNFAG
jgi:hypothetical protein